MNPYDKFQIKHLQWFLFFICSQIIIWSLLPIFVVKGTYIDVLENIEWGRHWQWGYDKNPFFGAVVTYLGYLSTNHSINFAFILSQIAVVTSLWAIWQLAKQILPSIYALLSVTLLIVIKYYNLDTTEFNDDVIELALWALSIYCFFLAVKNPTTKHWVFTGIFAALALMTKYYSIMLLFSMFMFLLINHEARKSFFNKNFYIGLLIFCIICLPNIIWLVQHSFVSIDYAFDRANLTKHALTSFSLRFRNVTNFIVTLIGDVLPLIAVAFFCFRKRDQEAASLDSFTWQYLLSMGFGPVFFTLLFILFTGADFRSPWATPLFSLWGILFIAWWRPLLTRKNLFHYTLLISLVFIFWCLFYIYYETIYAFHGKGTYEAFPGKTVAKTLTNEWHQRFHTPLPYVAGERLYVVNLTVFSHDHPHGFFEWDQNHSQWIDEKTLKQRGAMFLWNTDDQSHLNMDALRRFPQLKIQPIHYFNWEGNSWFVNLFHLKHIPPVAMGVAFLPPENSVSAKNNVQTTKAFEQSN